jgi:CspA family cold shock protein
MAQGRVVEWTPYKGFGIIQGDDGTPVFVHHTQITSPGFKNLVDGQRVRYEVKAEPRGSQAVQVVPLPVYEVGLSPEEWKLIEGLCAGKIQVSCTNSVDRWKRPQVTLTMDLKHRETMIDWVDSIQEGLKAGRPRNPVFIVDFEVEDGADGGCCAAGADSAEAAEALVNSKLGALLPEGVTDGRVLGSVTLAEYEEECRRALPPGCFPKPGEVVPLG